jgi:hypothetical protein
VITETEKLRMLNIYFDWSGAELPISEGQIVEFMEANLNLFVSENEAVDYLMTEIIRE